MSSGAGSGWHTETWVRWVYDVAQADPADPPHIIDLAEMVLGYGAVQLLPASALPLRRARLAERPERHMVGLAGDKGAHTYIQVRRRLPFDEQAFAVGHELAEWALRRVGGLDDEDVEQQADALGAGLIIPRASVSPEQRAFFQVTEARTFCVPPVCWALRWAEVTGEALAVVSPSGCHRRGLGWPVDDADLRRLARQETPALGGRPLWRRELRGRRVVLVDQ